MVRAIVAWAGVLVWAAVAGAAERPNILVIVADDLGWADLGFHGGKAKTPNLDRLAKEGVQLDQHYVAPTCSPTRCGFVSGRYWSRFGVNAPKAERAMPFDTVTIARAMKDVGYETAITGKWHLGSLPEWGPKHFGFDHSYGSLGGGTGPWDHRYKTGPYTRTWHRNCELIEEEGHVTDLLTAEAIRWIEGRGEKPFFLYVPFTAVHIPIKEPQQWQDANSGIEDKNERMFAACVTHMDDSIGRILAAVEKKGKLANTLVVFFSDNGGYPIAKNNDSKYPNPEQYMDGACGGHNEPLRGKKTEVYEGGIRVPALAYWKGQLKPGTAKQVIHVVDWMPTLCGLAGYEAKTDLKWDGRDVWKAIKGEEPAFGRLLCWKGTNGRSHVVRDGDWKLIVGQAGKDAVELFDLAKDPYEAENLAARSPEKVTQLKAILKELAARDNDRAVKEEKK